MEFIYTNSYEESAKAAADIIIGAVQAQPDMLLGLATGGTAEGIYAEIVKTYQAGQADFSRTRTVNLDEYVDCAEKYSYRYYMDSHFFNHVNIPKENITIADRLAEPESETARLRAFFAANRVDLQLLGLGPNGHIGFNEPGPELSAQTHVEALTQATKQANARFFDEGDKVPDRAITMGMGDILKARRILMVVHGENKRAVLKQLQEGGTVTCGNPSTFLLLHPNVTVIAQK